jgi:hypothetical protein
VIKHDYGVGQVLQSLKTVPNNSDVDLRTWACPASSRDYLALNCPCVNFDG